MKTSIVSCVFHPESIISAQTSAQIAQKILETIGIWQEISLEDIDF